VCSSDLLAEMTADTVRILEVGSGPIGVATYYPGVERLLVDPLEEYYASIPALCALRSTSAVYRTGVGEALPCDTGRYDLAIIENCIDHVQDMDGVMRELVRVTRPGGILYLTVNCRTRIGFVVHRILSRLMIDRGHPHTFTPAKLGRLLTRYGFAVLDLEIGSYDEAKAEDWCSTSSRARLKARLGISEFVASAIARRATT